MPRTEVKGIPEDFVTPIRDDPVSASPDEQVIAGQPEDRPWTLTIRSAR